METEPDCIVITGGTGKLGRIFTTGFAKRGNTVCFTSRSQDRIDELLRSPALSGASGKVIGVVAELDRPGGPAQLAEHISAKGLQPACLINNARSTEYLRMDARGMPSPENWTGEFTLDVVVPYQLSMLLARQPGQQLKSIVNIASMYGVVAANPALYDDPLRESPIHYSVVKAALIHLTKELAVRLAPQGVRVNAISYGGVSGRVSKEFEARYARLSPSRRMLKEEEVFGAAAYLASGSSAGMNGHNLVIDGGWTAW